MLGSIHGRMPVFGRNVNSSFERQFRVAEERERVEPIHACGPRGCFGISPGGPYAVPRSADLITRPGCLDGGLASAGLEELAAREPSAGRSCSSEADPAGADSDPALPRWKWAGLLRGRCSSPPAISSLLAASFASGGPSEESPWQLAMSRCCRSTSVSRAGRGRGSLPAPREYAVRLAQHGRTCRCLTWWCLSSRLEPQDTA